ncbi:AAA family ATPase [Roseofilum sp. BLCC_M154]|uniref:AAA family ATPase n=1 Tax=Roseofilum acuticapitatum BLCC-M154 TaxID=3022444 RepID=A0ABT7AQN4_9CYAN|nr:AAA family ATPase [Roseofilum acuticapitatum]MDJ1169214.1 AAA family ATPase [Roseofilum acuticapitatum BLCC-M154]
MMTAKEAFTQTQALLKQANRPFNDLEQNIFYGIWENLKYKDIAQQYDYSEEHIRATASKMFKNIKHVIHQDVSKSDLKSSLDSFFQSRNLSTFGSYQGDMSSVHPSGNPFIPVTGVINDPKLFFNRERDIRDIFEKLHASGGVALIGERQIGKSSLLKQMSRETEQLAQLQTQPIYLNLQDLENEDEFYCHLCDELQIEQVRGYQLKRVLKKHRLLLLIDEVEKMIGDGFTLEIRDKLRGFAENGLIKLVLAASQPLHIIFADEDLKVGTSPLANICLSQKLERWNESTSRSLIESRLEPTQVRFTEEEIVQIIGETQGHPQRLMQQCHERYNNYLENQ